MSLCLFGFAPSYPPTPPLLQLEAQEEKLRLEEEARNAAQREAARLARELKLKEVRRQTKRFLPPVCSDCLEKKKQTTTSPLTSCLCTQAAHHLNPSPSFLVYSVTLCFCF